MNKTLNNDSLDDLDGLTVFETFEELIGHDLALTLCNRHGGRDVYIPRKVADNHWLVLCIGRDAAEILCKHFSVGTRAGSRFLLPMGKTPDGKKHAPDIRRMTDRGCSASQIASALRIHVRTVYRARKKLKEARLRILGPQIQRMLRQGLSAEEIAAKLHIPLAGLKPVIAEVERRNDPVSSVVVR